jgi:hypothetical protein
VFENRVLRIIFGAKEDEVTLVWRKLHYEELCNCILRQVKLEYSSQEDEMGGVRGEEKWWESQRESDHYEDLDVRG